jgi:hypothetical protein
MRPEEGNMLRCSRLALILVTATGCAKDLDTTRQPAKRGDTFGAIIYQEACQRVAYISQLEEKQAGLRATVDVSDQLYGPVCIDDAQVPADAPPKVGALKAERPLVVSSVNLTLPKDFLDKMEAFLEAIVVLDDDGTMPAAIKSAADVLGKMIADPSFGDTLARFGARNGYRPLATAAGAVAVLLQYPGADDALASQLNVLLDDNGDPVAELQQLLTVLAREMASAQPLADPSDPSRTMRLALDLLFAPAEGAGDGTERPLLLRDHRGLARVAPDPQSGGVPAPFVDQDGDGLADIEPGATSLGRFIGSDGKPLAMATPFPRPGKTDPMGTQRDGQGRVLDGAGQPVYQHLDLDGTVLAALAREGSTLLDPNADNALGLMHGAGALLGPRVPRTKSYKDPKGASLGTLNYQSFNTDQSALLDLAWSFIQVLGAPKARDALRIARTLLSVYEDPSSRAVAAMLDVNDRGKADTHAHIPAASNIYDDLVPLIIRMLRADPRTASDGSQVTLLDDLLWKMQDPHVANLASLMGLQMANNDRFVLDQDGFVNNPPSDIAHDWNVSGSFSTLVDRSQPDSDYNRSVMQRMAHLVHDANGVRFCNKEGASISVAGIINIGNYHTCTDTARAEMFQIDDLGLFFVLAMADHSVTASQYAHDYRYDTTYSKASFREQITDSTLRGLLYDDDQTHILLFGDTTDQFMSGQLMTKIPGFTRFPQPQALARSLFLDYNHESSFLQSTIDPVRCSDGDLFIDVHNDSIFAWEARPAVAGGDSFYDAVQPLVTAFAMHDECVDDACSAKRNAAKIFVDLMATLHVYWASQQSSYFGHTYQSSDPSQPRYSTGDGVVTYEPLLADVFGNSDLIPSMINISPTLEWMTLDGDGASPRALPTLSDTLSYVFDPAVTPASLTYRNGMTSTVRSDGTTPVPRATPYYLIADAYAEKRAQLDAAPADRQGAWRAATATLVDEALTVATVNGMHQAKNRRMHAVTLALIDFLESRYDAHAAAGDVDAWLHQNLIGDLVDAVQGPLFAALSDLTARIEGDPDALGKIYGLLGSLVDTSNDAGFTTSLTGLGDLLQVLLDDDELIPIAHTLASVVDPASGATATQLKLLKKARALDPNRPAPDDTMHAATLMTVLRNLFQQPPNNAPTPISDLGDAIAEVNRCLAPDQGACKSVALPAVAGSDMVGGDYRHMLGEIQSFLSDEQRGFQRFIAIVKSRNSTGQ